MFLDGILTQWKIPPFQSQDGTGTTSPRRPLYAFTSFFDGIGDEDSHCFPQNPWHSLSRGGPDFLVLHSSNKVEIYQIRTQPKIPGSDCDFPRALPVHFASLSENYIEPEHFDLPGFCDDALVYKTLLDGIELSAHFLTPTSEHKIYETTSVDFCYDAPSGTILMSQFCPATGRLCLLSESNFIYILDFLSSPTRNIGMLLHSSLSPLLAHILTFFLFGRHHMYALMIAQTCFISCEPIFMVHWTLITCLYDEMDHLFRTLLPNELEIVVTSAHPIHYHFNRETKSNLNGFTNDNNSPACELVIESSDKTRSPDTSYPALFLTFSTGRHLATVCPRVL